MSPPALRLSLVAPSGSGKSTATALVRDAFERRGLKVAVLKLAAPLYDLQAAVYGACGRHVDSGQQDQQLLELIATQMRRIAPRALVDDFGRRLAALSCDVVLNDDLRDDVVDWPWMKEHGFSAVRVEVAEALRRGRLQSRADLTVVEHSPLDAQVARIHADYVLHNNGTLEELSAQVEQLTERCLSSSGRPALRQGAGAR